MPRTAGEEQQLQKEVKWKHASASSRNPSGKDASTDAAQSHRLHAPRSAICYTEDDRACRRGRRQDGSRAADLLLGRVNARPAVRARQETGGHAAEWPQWTERSHRNRQNRPMRLAEQAHSPDVAVAQPVALAIMCAVMNRRNFVSAILFAVPMVIAAASFQYREVGNQLTLVSLWVSRVAGTAPLLFGVVLAIGFGVILVLSYLTVTYLAEPTGLRDAKTTRYYANRNSDDYRSHVRRLVSRAKTIDVVGIGNSQFTSDASLEFYQQLLSERRCVVRILFLDPKGSQVAVRERDEEHAVGTLSQQVYKHLSYILKFMRALEAADPVARRLLEYRFYDRYPSCNMTMFDRETVVVQHYLYTTRGAISPIFGVTGKASWLVNFYREEFDELWKNARVPDADEIAHGTSVAA